MLTPNTSTATYVNLNYMYLNKVQCAFFETVTKVLVKFLIVVLMDIKCGVSIF